MPLRRPRVMTIARISKDRLLAFGPRVIQQLLKFGGGLRALATISASHTNDLVGVRCTAAPRTKGENLELAENF